MTDTSFWDERRGIIRTRKGGLVFSKGAVYCHGYSMMDELVGKMSFFQVLTLCATGKTVERRLADWIDAVYICMSYPDARIWCNQIGSLAGTMQSSSVAGVSAGILATDSYQYGVGPLTAGAQFIIDALAKKRSGMSADDIVRGYVRRPGSKPMITGYARPVARGDERLEAMERVADELGFERGEHLLLAYGISEVLERNYNEGINFNGYVVAFLADQGFSIDEIFRMGTVVASLGVLACYTEAADQAPESFFPLRCNDMDYQGKPHRTVPD